MGVLGDIFSGVAGLASTAYNISTNKRDFDYQKALQQQIFEREDTAVQRRVEDLKAAGLNPALANGSAASAGSVVSRSNTNDVNFGSALDYIAAANQIKSQKIEQKNAEKQNEILDYESDIKWLEKQIAYANTATQLGIPYHTYVFKNPLGQMSFKVTTDGDNAGKYFTSNIQNMFDYQYQNLKNTADMIQKQNNWYTADKIADYVGSVLPYVNFNFKKFIK